MLGETSYGIDYVLPSSSDLNLRDCSRQDILLTFGTDVVFATTAERRPLLSFPDAALFGLAFGWGEAVHEIVHKGRPAANYRDFYGLFDVWLTREQSSLIVEDRFHSTSFNTTVDATERATREWFDRMMKDARSELPDLYSNDDFQSLMSDLKRLVP